jgi:hypothetical protein
MGKLIKIFFVAGISAAFAFAQGADSTVVRDSSQTVTAAAVPASSSGEKKSVTGVKTTKPPTNWSKIKDLFL